jgi:hypothetical protein
MFIEEPDVGNLQVRFCEGRIESLTLIVYFNIKET